MKYSALIPAYAVLACAPAYAQERQYISGQAARLIIGQSTFTDQLPGTSEKLLGAAGGVAYARNTLLIADSSRYTGLTPQNRRIVIYRDVASKLPASAAAINENISRCPVCTARFEFGFDTVLGQADFAKNEPAVSQTGMRLPTAVATDGTSMVVADTENNRVLIWRNIPTSNNAPADIVLGQDSFTTVRQPVRVDNKSFRGPQGVWIQDGRLYVADTQNHRVMVWNSIPTQNNQAANFVLGQKDFNSAPEPDLTKLDQTARPDNLLNPTSVTSDGRRLYVSDLGYNRVLIWNSIPTQTAQPADLVVGQPDMNTGVSNNSTKLCAATGQKDTNGNDIYPFRCGATLDFPRFVLSDGQRLYISDGGNDRVLVFNSIPTANGATADVVLGQPDMTSNILTSIDDLFTPNFVRSAADVIPAPASLAWDGQNLYVADPTDRRVLVFTPESPDVARDGVRNAASLRIYALSILTFTSAPKENDEVTVKIADKEYKYKAAKDDKIEQVIRGLVAAINAGAGDPNILAVANVPFNSIALSARVPGDPGFAVEISATPSTGAQITLTLSDSNPTTQSSQRIAPGTVVTIFGKDLSATTTATPVDATQLPYELGGVQVYFDGIRAPIVSVSPTQVTAQVPYDVFDTTSISAWVRTRRADGSVKVTTAVAIPIAQSNPGVFAESGDEPRRAIAFHGSSTATISIAVDGTITENNTATITIEDRSYTYTVKKADTLAIVRDALIQLINDNPEEKLRAESGAAFPRVVLRAKEPGEAGNGIPVSTKTNEGASVLLSASRATTCCANTAFAPITEDNPALPGETIIVYATGLGLVGPETAKGSLQTGSAYFGPKNNDPFEFVSSLVGGRTANVIAAGVKVGGIGIYEVVLELNPDLPTNPQTQLTIAQNIYTSNIVTIPVFNPNPATP